jgi:hypothetical protein
MWHYQLDNLEERIFFKVLRIWIRINFGSGKAKMTRSENEKSGEISCFAVLDVLF